MTIGSRTLPMMHAPKPPSSRLTLLSVSTVCSIDASLDPHVREKTSHHDGLAKDEAEAFIAQPGDGDIWGAKAGGDQQGMRGTLLKLDLHDIVGQGDQADSNNKIAKIGQPLAIS